MATRTDLCPNGKFEWRGNELFVVAEAFHGDSAWIDSGVVERIRNACPDNVAIEDISVFMLVRSDSGDKVFSVEPPMVMYSGGDVLCFLKPLTTH